MIPVGETTTTTRPLATVTPTSKAQSNNDERVSTPDRQLNRLLTANDSHLESKSAPRQMSPPTHLQRLPAHLPPTISGSLLTIIENSNANKAPSDKHSGSEHHNTRSAKPEQLHKKPELASPGGFGVVSSEPAPITGATTLTFNKQSVNCSSSGGSLRHQNKNNLETSENRMEQRSIGVNCDTDTLTSLFAHVDEVRKELDLPDCSNLGPKVTTSQLMADSGSQNPISNDWEAKFNLPLSCTSIMGASSPISSSSPSASSLTASLTPRKLSRDEEDMELRRDQLRSMSGSSGGDSHRSFSGTSSITTVNEVMGEDEEQQCGKRKHTDDTVLMLRHLIQKRNELRIIDKQLYEIITQYQIQLDLIEQCNKWPMMESFAQVPIEEFLELKAEKRIQLALSSDERQQYTIVDRKIWPTLVADSFEYKNANEALDLTLRGATFPASSSGAQSILAPAKLKDSKRLIKGSTSPDNNDTGSITTTTIKSNASTATDADARGFISNTKQQHGNNFIANSDTNNGGQATRNQPTINHKKSRLLGASNLSNVCGDMKAQKLMPTTTTTTTTNTQLGSIDINDQGVDGVRSTPINQILTTSSLDLCRRYKTPPPSVTMGTSPTTSSPPLVSGTLKLEQNHQISTHHQQHKRQPVILTPLTPSAAVISSTTISHHQQLGAPNEVSAIPETQHLPLHKKFRSVAQMLDTDHVDKPQTVANCYAPFSSEHYPIGASARLPDINHPNEGEVSSYGLQTYHLHSTPLSYSLHQLKQSNSIAPIVAADDHSLAQLNHQINLSNTNLHHYPFRANHDGTLTAQDECCNKVVPIVCADQCKATAYILATRIQPITSNQNSDSGGQNQLLMPNGYLADSGTISPARLATRDSLEIMANSNSCRVEEHPQPLVPALARLAPVPHDPQRIGYRCHVCGSGFEDRHRLQQHLSIHLILHPSWYEEKTIKETMARYESKRGDYQCASCNQRFETTSEFDRHMHLHREKPHLCDLCGQDNKMVSFRYYRQLLTHLRSHCFLYSCRFTSECKQTANRKDYLKLHILKHHLNNKLPEQYTVCCH